MKITEIIADTLLQLLNEQGGTIQIQRNNLASEIGCVPSQINYVITSRFNNSQGYIVESRRGGGGFIKIIRVNHSKKELILHVINSIGNTLDESSARILIAELFRQNSISLPQSNLLNTVMSDSYYKNIDEKSKDVLKSNLFKAMLITTISE